MKCDHCGCLIGENEGTRVTRPTPGQSGEGMVATTPIEVMMCVRCASRRGLVVQMVLVAVVLLLLAGGLIALLGYLIT